VRYTDLPRGRIGGTSSSVVRGTAHADAEAHRHHPQYGHGSRRSVARLHGGCHHCSLDYRTVCRLTSIYQHRCTRCGLLLPTFAVSVCQSVCLSRGLTVCVRAGNNRFESIRIDPPVESIRIDSIWRIEFTLSSIRLYGFSCKSLDTAYNNLEKNHIPAKKVAK